MAEFSVSDTGDQLISTCLPTPGKCWTPFGTKNYIFSELMEYNEGMSNMLGVSSLNSGRFWKQNDQYMWLIVFSYQINLKACNNI